MKIYTSKSLINFTFLTLEEKSREIAFSYFEKKKFQIIAGIIQTHLLALQRDKCFRIVRKV